MARYVVDKLIIINIKGMYCLPNAHEGTKPKMTVNKLITVCVHGVGGGASPQRWTDLFYL